MRKWNLICIRVLMFVACMLVFSACINVEAASKITYGDLNHDGKISATDLAAMTQAVNGEIIVSDDEFIYYDLNGDEVIDENDKDLLNQYILKDIFSFPVEELLDYIEITTLPNKTKYYTGDTISYDGMVVTAYYRNESSKIVTSYTTSGNTSITNVGTVVSKPITVSYTEKGIIRTSTFYITVSKVKLASIEISTPPLKTSYVAGEWFDSTGMVAKARYTNSGTVTKTIDNSILNYNPSVLQLGDTYVQISYTVDGVTKSVNQTITVCSQCDMYGHTWNGGVVTKEATSTETGIKMYTCSVCNVTELEVIPLKDVKNYDNWNYYEKDDGTVCIVKYTGQETEITIPSIIEKNVSEIGDYIFSTSTDIKTISIPDSITISEHSFEGCDNAILVYTDNGTVEYVRGCCGDNAYFQYDKNREQLRIYGSGKMYDYTRYHGDNAAPWKEWFDSIKNVRIESGLTYIGTYAFAGWPYGKGISPAIEEVVISDTVTEIADNAFYNCISLKNITLSNSLQKIGDYAFACDLGLENIKLPDSLKMIDYSAFLDCSFKELTFPAGTAIEISAFYSNKSLEKVTFGNNCILSNMAFGECSSLSDVSIGEGSVFDCKYEEGIVNGPFYKCTSLKSLKLPNSWQLYDFDNNRSYVLQFLDCDALTNIILDDDNPNYKMINQVIYTIDGQKLIYYPKWLTTETYTIEDSTKEISERAFYGQNYLKHIEIPDSVEKICYDAFNNMTIESIVIPDSVTEVECGSLFSAKKVSISTNITQLPDGNNKLSIPNVLNDNIGVIYGKQGSYAEIYAIEKNIPFKERIEVSFNAAGGTVSKNYKVVLPDEPYFTLPTPTRENYNFDGWYTEEKGGDKVEYSTIVTPTVSHTLYAHWSVDDAIKQSASNELEEYINIEDYSNKNQELIQSIIDKAQDDIANATDADEINNIIQQAKSSIDEIKTRTEECITVSFDAMGGTASQEQMQVVPGEAYSTLPTTVRENYQFDGWHTLVEGGEKIESTTIVTQTTNHTLYAHWSEKKVVYEDDSVVVPETDKHQPSQKDMDNDDNEKNLGGNEGISGDSNNSAEPQNNQSDSNNRAEQQNNQSDSNNSAKQQDNQSDSIIKDIPSLDVKDIVKEYSKKIFSLSVKTDSDGEISFSGANKKVAEISKTGKVKLKKYGKVIITVYVKESEKYKAVTKSFTLSVVPKKVSATRVQSPSKGAIRFKWKKVSDIDGYQVYVSSTKNFKAGTAGKKFNKKEKLMFTTGFSSGKKYYLNIRTYKKVGKETYYSPWGKVKSVKVK